ncbi:MAG: hypothetical protein NC250_00225 [Alistipes senegalensis]|nr:hypothetical protein [Alistipes senegalensis]
MNVLHRLFAFAALCGSVACSESGLDFEPAVPGQQFRTVVIGCAGIDINTRTEIDDRLGVRWVSGDSIRLWARQSSDGAAFALENIPFVFDYYSPQFKQAAFTGHEVDMAGFDSGRRYDYFAVSPTPASVTGTLATFDIPAVQSGEFNSGYDIMTAQTNAPALEEGDTNWWKQEELLLFKHHVHVFKITIPSNRLEAPKFPGMEEAIRSIELTFPDPVTGRLTVDATGAAEPVFTPAEGGNVLTLRFDRPKQAGDVVYAFIARQEPLSGDGKVIIRATGASGGDKPCVSVDRTFTKTREFTRGRVTTLNYNIPERYRCTKILFSLAEKAGGEAPDRAITNANGYGWGTLGEPIESFRIVDASTGEELPASAFVCNHVANRYEITCTDEGAHTAFINRYAGKECIAKLTSQSAEVEYPFTVPALEAEVENMVPALEVPWLLSLLNEDLKNEDGEYISASDGHDNPGYGTHSDTNTKATHLGDFAASLMDWSAVNVGVQSGAIRVNCRSEFVYVFFWSKNRYHGRIDSAPLKNLTSTKNIKVSMEYTCANDPSHSANVTPLAAYGYTTDTNVKINSDNKDTGWVISNATQIQNIPLNGTFESGFLPLEYTIADCGSAHRLSWEVGSTEEVKNSNANSWLYIRNIRVSIAH